MEYAVIRHGDMDSVVVFMKALDDGAVYFKNKAGTRQWIINLLTSNGRGGDIAFELRKQLRAKGLTAQADEINKAAQSLLSAIKHSDESSDDDDEIIIDEGVEIIDAPYPEHGKAQIPRRCFIYDDEDGYPEGYEGYIEHHGILGMKWGVRRYQNADGSLTEAGRKHYGRKLASANRRINSMMESRAIPRLAAEEVVRDELNRKKYNSEKGRSRLTKSVNRVRVDAIMKEKSLDMGNMQGSKGVLQYEQEYDRLSNEIRKKFGDEGLKQIQQYIKDNDLDIGDEHFQRAASYRKKYEQLYNQNQEKIEKIFDQKLSDVVVDKSVKRAIHQQALNTSLETVNRVNLQNNLQQQLLNQQMTNQVINQQQIDNMVNFQTQNMINQMTHQMTVHYF